MLSEMAAEDIKYLTGLGVKLEPAQTVRLNDLALRVTHGKRSADFIHAPRVAWVNREHVLHEPTIAMGMWLRDNASQWWDGDKLLYATAWASSHCHERGFFETRVDPESVSEEIDKWRKSLNCTAEQMLCALYYVIDGDESRAESFSVESAMAQGCPYTDIIADAVAACLGATMQELEAKPIRIVEEYVRRWARNQAAQAGVRADFSIRGRNKDLEAYQAYVEELEKGAVKNGES